jgi:hypothetical protein
MGSDLIKWRCCDLDTTTLLIGGVMAVGVIFLMLALRDLAGDGQTDPCAIGAGSDGSLCERLEIAS